MIDLDYMYEYRTRMDLIRLVYDYLIENGVTAKLYRDEYGEPLLYVEDNIRIDRTGMTKIACQSRVKQGYNWRLVHEFNLYDPESLPNLVLCLCDTLTHTPDKNGQQKLDLERLWKP
jgi:hypothetical protein